MYEKFWYQSNMATMLIFGGSIYQNATAVGNILRLRKERSIGTMALETCLPPPSGTAQSL